MISQFEEKPKHALAVDPKGMKLLAKTEGLLCYTPAELARAKARLLPPVTPPPASDDEATALASRFAACDTPYAQTAFWRGLTSWERTALTRAKSQT